MFLKVSSNPIISETFQDGIPLNGLKQIESWRVLTTRCLEGKFLP